MSEKGSSSASEVRWFALGGLGEIGMNMMVLECDGDLLLLDCGLMFPESYMFGIDLVLPDISAIAEKTDRIRALVLTHGHEDHIGAIPYLLPALGFPPIYGSGLTLGLVRNKLREHDLIDSAHLHQVRMRETVRLGAFEVEFFRAAHSIVDGAGLAIRSPAGLIVHTGDFKIDNTPVDGERTDLARLAALGDEGVELLLSDSTNVERAGTTLSEQVVGEALNEIMPRCKGLVVISTFSSNIHRIQQAMDAARACGRSIILHGRSMEQNCAVARQLGYLQVPDEALCDLRDLRDLDRDKVAIITTGSQGEPLSALVRISHNDHKQIVLEHGDTVILSSKFIPGNEKAIANLINNLYRRGAEVVYETTSEIHVSGHAAQDELKTMLALTRPRHFVPIHGEYRHLVKHAQLARSMGLGINEAFVVGNGMPVILSREGVRLGDEVETGRVLVDGKGVGDVGALELRDRRHLANHGMVTAVLGVNSKSGEIVYGPELLTRGFVPEEDSREYLEQAAAAVREVLTEHSLEAISDWEELRVEVRKALRRFFNRTIQRRPLIVPIIMEL